MGCYPLFACRDWSELESDLSKLDNDLIAVSLVTDPFGDYDEELLRHVFKDRCFAFKEHYVADLCNSREDVVSRHHRRNAQWSLEQVSVRICSEPDNYLDAVWRLYENLIARHDIRGIQRLSRGILAKQLVVPGTTVLCAEHDGNMVGMTIWYEYGDTAYYHLGASSDAGYALKASFALFWTAWAHFAGRLRWLSLGAGAGVTAREDGLSRFKKGWATGTRTAYFCGCILDPTRYDAICRYASVRTRNYFPAYRVGEFG
jgi:hypothetical protein